MSEICNCGYEGSRSVRSGIFKVPFIGVARIVSSCSFMHKCHFLIEFNVRNLVF